MFHANHEEYWRSSWKRILKVILAVNLWKIALASNLDVQYPIIFEDPHQGSGRGSYFGYSLIMHFDRKFNSSWLQIGAPRANYSDSKYSKNITEPGVVYICSIQPIGKCKELLLDTMEGNQAVTQKYKNLKDRKEGSWLGASMDIQPGPNGRIVVCAPRWSNQFYNDSYDSIGVCFWMHAENDNYNQINEIKATKLIPLLDEDRRVYIFRNTSYPDFGAGQAGMSVHMPVKKYYQNASELLLGAPGLKSWRGGVVLYEDDKNIHKNYNDTLQEGSFSEFSVQGRKFVQFKDSDYVGYQVNSGNFFRPDKLLYVASAPRAENLKGWVLFFILEKKKKKHENKLTIKIKVKGIQIGEYFGACIAVIDLNKDGLDDLIVGAPLYNNKISRTPGYEEGRLAVLLGGKPKLIDKEPIFGKETGARFGSAIANLGDLDSDGFSEVGVGAPYAQGGRGKVFIYTSGLNGLSAEPVQILTARDTHGSLRGFGSSINNVAADIDSNGCPDVAIGAYKSGHAVIFRGMPVIRWRINHPIPNPTKIPQNALNFTLTDACVSYDGRNISNHLVVLRRLTMDTRHSEINSTSEKEINLKRGQSFCENLLIILKEKILDKQIPITIDISYDLKENASGSLRIEEKNASRNSPILVKQNATGGIDGFCKSCPISRDSTSYVMEIPFETKCGDKLCQADLRIIGKIPELDISPDGRNISYVTGSTRYVALKISVTNNGSAEPAYVTHVYVEIGWPAKMVKTPRECTTVTMESFSCDGFGNKEWESSVNYSNQLHASNIGSNVYESRIFPGRNTSSVFLRCDLDDPLHPSAKRDLTVELDMTNTYGSKFMELKAWATTTSVETNPSDNCWSIAVELRNEADVTIYGGPDTEQYTYFKENKIENERISFYHIYETQKFGHSSLQTVDLEIQIPVSISTEDLKSPIQFLDIKEIQGFQKSRPLICAEKDDSGEKSFKYDPAVHDIRKSYGRQENNENNATLQVPSDRTLYLNCSSSAREDGHVIKCITVTCAAGPFLNNMSLAKVLLSLELDVDSLQVIMGQRDMILLETHGFVRVNDPDDLIQPSPHQPDHDWSYTLFVKDVQEKKVELWIIALAIAAGNMLLLFLAMALAKAGFFQRKKKEELKELKRMTILEEAEINRVTDEREADLKGLDLYCELEEDIEEMQKDR